MKTEAETRYTIFETDKEGKTKRKSVTELKYNSLCADAKEASQEDPNAEKVQTFQRYNVESIEDFLSLVPDTAEQLNIINRTLDIKQTDRMRDLMESEGFQTVEGVFDLAEACAAKTERKSMSDMDRAAKTLDKLTPAQQEQLLKMLAERLGVSA